VPGDPPPTLIPDGLDATLVLVRHGETPDIVAHRFQGRRPTPLSELGRRQVALAGARLGQPHAPPPLPIPNGPPLELVHSPLRRCAESAELIRAALAGPVATAGPPPALTPDDAFSELDQGAWEGLTHDEIRARFADDLAAWRRRPAEAHAPGGESLAAADARMRAGLSALLARTAEGRSPGTPDRSQVPGTSDPPAVHPWVVIVGHDGIFKLALLALFDLPLERFWWIAYPLAGITIVELRAGRPVLRAHGLTDHLAPLADATGAAGDPTGETGEDADRGGAL
jgi:probable phosphoglycerate mutase